MALLQAHRGVSTEYPENTVTAFLAAIEQGYAYIELDPEVTADNAVVLMHDKTLNRTARNGDGSLIGAPVYVSDITYAQALTYDVGAGFHPKFKGERIPQLSDVLALAEKNGVKVKIDNKIWGFSADRTETVLDVIKSFPFTAAITCTSTDQIKKALSVIPNAEIHYDGSVDESALRELSALVPKERLTVWLPIKCAATSWVKVRFADKELCDLVKRYAQLGIWNVSEYSVFDTAENELSADIIETNGQIKPERSKGLLADMHCHTNASHDALSDPLELCEAALKNGIGIFAVTDHFDGVAADRLVPYEIATHSKKNFEKARDRYGERLQVLFGMEYGEAFWVPDQQKKVDEAFDFDVKLGSVHAVRHELTRGPFAWLDFSGYTEEQIRSYYRQYLDDMLENLNSVDFDVLTHLDNPKKYLTAKFGFPLPYSDFSEQIDKILDHVIAHGIALEINTATVDLMDEFMPSHEILQRWREKGGYLVTFGADSHCPERVGKHLDRAIATLKELGLRNIFYYKNRRSYQISI